MARDPLSAASDALRAAVNVTGYGAIRMASDEQFLALLWIAWKGHFKAAASSLLPRSLCQLWTKENQLAGSTPRRRERLCGDPQFTLQQQVWELISHPQSKA
eukprot:1779606-Rhodomonas_salina.2